mmetsp:Transcript_35841/g.54943  ORF Transcript_35841/g.54943 Transcript_35841/m.54943 type:complete len:93 (+) Transcript_35841:96-374(+)
MNYEDLNDDMDVDNGTDRRSATLKKMQEINSLSQAAEKKVAINSKDPSNSINKSEAPPSTVPGTAETKNEAEIIKEPEAAEDPNPPIKEEHK